MGKIRLDVDALRVESFETSAGAAPRGTVRGHGDTLAYDRCDTNEANCTLYCPGGSGGASCDGSCDSCYGCGTDTAAASCNGTCAGATCGETCLYYSCNLSELPAPCC